MPTTKQPDSAPVADAPVEPEAPPFYRVIGGPTCQGIYVDGRVVEPGHKTSKIPPSDVPGLLAGGYIEPAFDNDADDPGRA